MVTGIYMLAVMSISATTIATTSANQGDMTMLLSLPKLFLALTTGI
jgi:hypothetical protein